MPLTFRNFLEIPKCVVTVCSADIKRLVDSFRNPRYNFDEKAIHKAIKQGEMFNLIDSPTGLKVDFWPLKADAYHQICLWRGEKHTILGQNTFIATPEGVILAKLEWYKLSGGSEPQFKDALDVY